LLADCRFDGDPNLFGSRRTGPLSLQSLNIGGGNSTDHFIFGNSTLNQVTIGTVIWEAAEDTHDGAESPRRQIRFWSLSTTGCR